MVSEFNGKITSRMQAAAEEKAGELKISVRHISHVPGAYDMPLIADALLKRGDIDAVVALGAIIKGQTKHDEVIAHAVAAALWQLSVKHGKPVTLGISGPAMQPRQAHARIRPVAERAVEAAHRVYDELGRASAP